MYPSIVISSAVCRMTQQTFSQSVSVV